MKKLTTSETGQVALPMTIQDQPNSNRLLETLPGLRLKYWSEIMLKDLAEMPSSEQGIIL